jgi:hypothetical protein
MRPMEPTTVGAQPASQRPRAGSTEAKTATKPRELESQILPGFGENPILPAWLTNRVRRLLKHAAS